MCILLLPMLFLSRVLLTVLGRPIPFTHHIIVNHWVARCNLSWVPKCKLTRITDYFTITYIAGDIIFSNDSDWNALLIVRSQETFAVLTTMVTKISRLTTDSYISGLPDIRCVALSHCSVTVKMGMYMILKPAALPQNPDAAHPHRWNLKSDV